MPEASTTPDLVELVRAGSKSRARERYGLTLTFNAAGLIVRLDVNRDIDEARAAAERLAKERG